LRVDIIIERLVACDSVQGNAGIELFIERREVETLTCFFDSLRIPLWLLGNPSYRLAQAFAVRQ
jgi:hypothetical protein